MYEIEAIVRNSTFYQVKKDLVDIDISTFSAYPVQITGLHISHEGMTTHSSNYIPKSNFFV